MNADGTDLRRLTFSAGSVSAPAWSPDGSKIAFNRFIPFSSTSVHVMNSDGTGEALLAAQASGPAWSPDGTTIAFSRGGIWLMDADGANQRALTTGDEVPECGFPDDSDIYIDNSPNWSPSGDQLAYGTYIQAMCNDGFEAYAIRTVNADGSGIRQIFHFGEGCGSGHPAWAPDGTKIAFDFCALI